MCLLVLAFHVVAEAPVLVAANREERFDRPSLPPQPHPGPPRFVCGVDRQAGGTWLGVNEYGLVAVVTNRPGPLPPTTGRSRGLLCLDLLGCASAGEAARLALAEISRGIYAGANYVCLDRGGGAVVHGGREPRILSVEPGVHLMTNGDLDDPQDRRLRLARKLLGPPPASVEEFMARTATVCANGGLIIRTPDRGTVSSDQVAVTLLPQEAVYRHAPGPPDRFAYEEHSAVLRPILRAAAAPPAPTGPRSRCRSRSAAPTQ